MSHHQNTGQSHIIATANRFIENVTKLEKTVLVDVNNMVTTPPWQLDDDYSFNVHLT
jgi:hypothetical protein